MDAVAISPNIAMRVMEKSKISSSEKTLTLSSSDNIILNWMIHLLIFIISPEHEIFRQYETRELWYARKYRYTL